MTLPAFGRRALTELLEKTPDFVGHPSLPLQGLRQQGDMFSGFVDLPDSRAGALVRAFQRSVRGVFTQPWVAGGAVFPPPSGFSATSHRPVWAKVQRYSDLIYTALQTASIRFDGLVCPRLRGDLGFLLVKTPWRWPSVSRRASPRR